jgi:glycosyltransferase involved in cell wall biosynthesis
MKILHLSNIAGRLGGGVSEVVHSLLLNQHQFGCDPVLFFIGKKDQETEISKTENIDISHLNALPLSSFMKPAAFRNFINASNDYEVIHQHGVFMPISLFSLFLHKRKKIIVSPHGYLEPEKMKVSFLKKKIVLFLFERNNLKSCHCLVACSNQEARFLRDFGLTQPIAILPNGVSDKMLKNEAYKDDGNLLFRNKYGIAKDTKILLFLSRIHPFKGLDLLLRSIHKIKDQFTDKNWVFVIAGIDELNHENDLKHLVDKLKLSKIVKFIGPQYAEDKIQVFDAANSFILPSKGENFGIAVIEALARGVPVIATKNTPWKELEASKCGWWVDRTEEGFINAFTDLFSSTTEELENMGVNGINLVKNKYTWSNIANQSSNIYKWVTNNFDDFYKKGFDLFD